MLERLFPFRCLLCLAPGDGHDLCNSCRTELPWLRAACPRCAAPLPGPGTSCGSCLRRPPPQAATVAAFHYAFPVDRLLLHLKFANGPVAGRVLGELLADRLAPGEVDLIVPVPLHRYRLRERGFNQAYELATPVSRALRLPVMPDGCRRTRATPPQTGLTGAARRRNVADAFVATKVVKGRHVAVVDDVVTTGSTVAAVSAALYRAGAASVQVWCVARA